MKKPNNLEWRIKLAEQEEIASHLVNDAEPSYSEWKHYFTEEKANA